MGRRWAGTVAYFGPRYSCFFSNNVSLAETLWTFIPNEAAIVNSFAYFYPETGTFSEVVSVLHILMLVQGPLTFGDERYWICTLETWPWESGVRLPA
jgi:hypothetical protein